MRDMHDYQVDHQRTRKNFNAAALGYDGVAVLQREVGQRLLERLELIKLQPARIMDLGSGTGVAARQLQQRYRKARIIQVDFALQMLRLARRQSRRIFSRQAFACAAAEGLPFAGTIDMTFSNLMLQWCNDPARVFAQAHQAMSAGALIIFSSFGPDTLLELRESWAAVDEDTHVNAFLDMHDLGDVLTMSGFESPVMEVEQLTISYEDARSLFRDLQGLGAANATAGRRRTLTGKGRLQGVVDAYEKFRRNGRLPATFEVVYGHAWNTRPDLAGMHSGIAAVPVSRIKRRTHG